MKYALGIEYEGTSYYGWQTQKTAPSIQTTLQQALGKVSLTPMEVHGAGRTDRGVHVTHQILHFETEALREEKAWVMGTNTHLPRDIRILWAREVPSTFHARFSALSRRYHYLIYNHPVASAPFFRNATWHYHPLRVDLMNEALGFLTGEHDFSSFRAAGCQAKHGVREIFSASVKRKGAFLVVEIHGNAFLHHMVRNIVGALLKVGREEQPPQWLKTLLEKKDRKAGGITAPPQGLYLTEVQYPLEFSIPQGCRLPLLLNAEGENHHGES